MMKMIKIEDLFDVEYPKTMVLNKQTLAPDGVNFVSSKGTNNGISSKIRDAVGYKKYKSGAITVALKGSVMSPFLQPADFYIAHQTAVLYPKKTMNDLEKLFYCLCLQANKYRFNYGRQADRTLRALRVPDQGEIPDWVYKQDLSKFDHAKESKINKPVPRLDVQDWRWFTYDQLFNIERGRGPRKNELNGNGKTPFVSSTDANNGLTDFTEIEPIHLGNTLGVNRNGSVAEAFYQPVPFCSTEDVHIFSPKFKMDQYIGLFLAALIRKEKYRFNYGRKWGIARMQKTKIKLPISKDGTPDFQFMGEYIKSLPFSSQI